MLRLSILSLFAATVLLISGCNTTNTNPGTTEPVADTTATEETNTAVDMGTTGTESELGYNIEVTDGNIKSPRKKLTGNIDDVAVTIDYGSPAVNGRTIYGDLVPYGKVWRTGANEATRIEFAEDVMVGAEGKMLPAGTYSLFTLPADKDNWTIIFNKTAVQWGAYDYVEEQDAVRVRGEAEPLNASAERMDFALDGNEVELMWADRKISFTVQAASR